MIPSRRVGDPHRPESREMDRQNRAESRRIIAARQLALTHTGVHTHHPNDCLKDINTRTRADVHTEERERKRAREREEMSTEGRVSASGHDVTRLKQTTSQLAKDRKLSIKQRYVLGGGTEPPFSGRFTNGVKYNTKRRGTFNCAVCDLPAYASSAKFKSGTGWPSFYEPIDPDHVWETTDVSHGMVRKEVKCVRCHAHQGHVFNDGPRPTGKRYCVNAASLTFQAGQGEDERPSHGLAAGLVQSISRRLNLRRKKNKAEEPSAMAPSTAA